MQLLTEECSARCTDGDLARGSICYDGGDDDCSFRLGSTLFQSYLERNERYDGEEQRLHLLSELPRRAVKGIQAYFFADKKRDYPRERYVSATVYF